MTVAPLRPPPARDWVLHHVGVAVPALGPAIELHEALFGHRLVGGPYMDVLQNVHVCFVKGEQDPTMIELVAPAGAASPIGRYLARGIGGYHVCYEVEALDRALAMADVHACRVVSGPTPAIAFAGRSIAWLFTPSRQLVELLERAPEADRAA